MIGVAGIGETNIIRRNMNDLNSVIIEDKIESNTRLDQDFYEYPPKNP